MAFEKKNMAPSIKYSGSIITICSCVTVSETGKIVRIDGTMDV